MASAVPFHPAGVPGATGGPSAAAVPARAGDAEGGLSVVFGAAGHAQEVDWLLADIHAAGGPDLRPALFVVADGDPLAGSRLRGRPVVDERTFFAQEDAARARHFVAMGSAAARARTVQRLQAAGAVQFPSLVHPSVAFDRTPGAVRLGQGVFVFARSVLTTDVQIGDFAQVNVACTVSHNSRIGAYATLSPGVHVCGNVVLGARVFLGCGAVVIERRSLADDVVVGAGAVVVDDLVQAGTYVGVPARRIAAGAGG
jgi:sugar O-acyltransferase (sialic acid O-acetyltransferase NeuD family)